jgi:hypothetical protein
MGDAAVNQRKVTARFYAFEDHVWKAPSFVPLKKRASMDDLIALTALVWKAEKGRGAPPSVQGRKAGTKYSHYIYEDHAIHLAPKHQHLGGLLHELAHALGPNDKLTHGPAFRRRCLHLYRTYGGWSGMVDF